MQIQSTIEYVEVGRSTIRRPTTTLGNTENDQISNFVDTNYALRLMESAGVCISQNEPTLLVGGKSYVQNIFAAFPMSILSYFAVTIYRKWLWQDNVDPTMSFPFWPRELVVQNLSLQTDSTDLLGGYRPLEIRHIARIVLLQFFQFSEFTIFDYVTAAYEKGQCKRLSQCFQRAAKMGRDKMKKQQKKDRAFAMTSDIWFEFKRKSERFEKQRVACSTGLAFAFTEGALVEAIRTGKW